MGESLPAIFFVESRISGGGSVHLQEIVRRLCDDDEAIASRIADNWWCHDPCPPIPELVSAVSAYRQEIMEIADATSRAALSRHRADAQDSTQVTP